MRDRSPRAAARARALVRALATALALATAPALGGGCGSSGGPAEPADVTAAVSTDIASVVKVSWTTAAPTVGYVEYGPTSSLGAHTPIESAPSLEHAATLLGLRADTDYFYRVVTWESAPTGSAAGASKTATVRTGPLPAGLPQLIQTGSGHSGFVLTSLLGGTHAVVILDPEGQIVWYHCAAKNAAGQPDCAAPEVPGVERLDAYRARISRDGKSVIYNYAKISGEPSQSSALVRVSLDGSQVQTIPIPLLAHDFVELADGTLAALVFEDRELDGTRYRGNHIVEVAPDGTQRIAWTSWDCFDPAAVKGDDLTLGWTFANALDVDFAGEAYYVGMRNFSSIAKVDRQRRTCLWVLGAGAPTLTLASGSARFLHQHQFHVQGNRILVMDNDGMGGQMSRVLEYELDLGAKTATEVWRYLPAPSVYTFVLGEPVRLADGGVFINWSAAGQMERLNAAGQSLWKLNSNAGTVFGFHTLADDLYAAGGGTVAALREARGH